MKVLFVTSLSETDIPVPVRPIHMVRCLPCDLVECYTLADVRQHIGTSDVVLLSGYKCVPYQRELEFIHKSPVLTGRVHIDLWNDFVVGDKANFNVRIVVCKELLRKYKPKWIDLAHWSPFCIDVQPYQLFRDIDILFWGRVGGIYPFRQLVVRELESRTAGKPIRIDPYLTMRKVVIGGREYTYAHATVEKARSDGVRTRKQRMYAYSGYKLYRLLSRAHVCCTGPSKMRVPVGKYFENAACGVVSLSPDFTDSANLGFAHKETIWFTDSQHFIKDLQYLLENRQMTDCIGEQARDLIQSRHTPEIRAKQLYEFLYQKLDERDEHNR